MRHPIDPKIDCVFKALLGADGNRRLLIHCLNAVLGDDLPAPVVEVEILNPYNEREFLDDKLSIVDVKARDGQQRVFQVEIQLLVLPDLPARILYGWADLYRGQIKSGQDYGELKPTYSIWLLGENLRPEEMRQAMSTLKGFSEKERDYHAYQARQNYLRQQRSIQRHIEELQAAAEQARAQSERLHAEKERERAEKDRERADKEAALQRESAALAEIERLKNLLDAKPDA